MADNAILYKYLAKSVGMKHGITPSFMAKPWANVSLFFLTAIVLFLTFHQLPGCSGYGTSFFLGENASYDSVVTFMYHYEITQDATFSP